MEENTKDVTKQSLDKYISMYGYQEFNQMPQQKPRIEMQLYQQKYCQVGLKKTEIAQ